ncbi:MAG: hypothetical protein WA001_03790, partial [Patescibacteria group bacterium]
QPWWDRLMTAWEAFLHPRRGGYANAAVECGLATDQIREYVREGRFVVVGRIEAQSNGEKRQRRARPSGRSVIEAVRKVLAVG